MNRSVKRELPEGEVLRIACALIVNPQGEVLLLKRHPKKFGGNKWGFPGGKIMPFESADSTVVREIKEETGIDLLAPQFLCEHLLTMPHAQVQMTSYRAWVDQQPILLATDEHIDYGWFLPADIIKLPDLLYGVPTLLQDYDLITNLIDDVTLTGKSAVVLLSKA